MTDWKHHPERTSRSQLLHWHLEHQLYKSSMVKMSLVARGI